MSYSSNGYISLGFLLNWNNKFPWERDYDSTSASKRKSYNLYDWEDWYCDCVSKFTPTFDIFGEHGYVLPNIDKEVCDKYWEERLEFKKANPAPFHMFLLYDNSNDAIMLCVPSSVITSPFGEPRKLKTKSLEVNQEDFDKFMQFVKEYFPEFADKEPEWYLCCADDED
jgi:hypothetical protein